MMRRINFFLLLCLISFSTSPAMSKTSPECLKHLGGTSYDVDCYGGLTRDVQQDSERVFKQLRASMPAGSKFRQLLEQYMVAETEAEKFCLLDKEAGTDWVPSPSTDSYNMWDAIYAGCIYNTRKLQNARLHSLLKLHNED